LQLPPFVTASLAAQTMTGVISVNTCHMTSSRGRNRCPHLRENEPTRSRQGSSKQASKQVQVQVLLRPTGDFFCLTQFQNQYPELDPGLRPGPVYFLGRARGRPSLPRGACGCRGRAAFSGAHRPMAMHVHAYARIRPRLDFSGPGQQAERGGFDMPPPQCGRGRRAAGPSGAHGP
jgi:hypothetical protein